MQSTVSNWREFQARWSGPLNFLMAGDCVPFEFDLPPLEEIVDILRRDNDARIGSGTRADRLLRDDISATFRAMPIEQAMEASFSIAHYSLSRFDTPGGMLHGFEKRVLDPWRDALKKHGFTFDRCYPIIFISGKGCATNYHLDFSHVLAWQRYGTKRFCGLKEPGKWTTREQRVNYQPGNLGTPPELKDDDALCFEMKPGAVLWNVLLTPHWVEASDGVAMSFNLSHGGVRFQGELSPFEAELEAHRKAQGLGAAVNAKY